MLVRIVNLIKTLSLLTTVMAVIALCVSIAIAGVNFDVIKAAQKAICKRLTSYRQWG